MRVFRTQFGGVTVQLTINKEQLTIVVEQVEWIYAITSVPDCNVLILGEHYFYTQMFLTVIARNNVTKQSGMIR